MLYVSLSLSLSGLASRRLTESMYGQMILIDSAP